LTSASLPDIDASTTKKAMETEGGTSDSTRDYSFLEPLTAGIQRPRPGFFYTLGLLLVAFTMVLLPVIYVALIGLAGWAVYFHAFHHFEPIMTWGSQNWRVMLIKGLVYATPIIVGLIIIFFMIKPLLSRRRTPPQSLALNPANEPVLFAFIDTVARAVGAPIPRRVDLDCQLNAAAGFRRGFLSFLGNDLVLVIGLPLAGNLTVAELAGVLAHEFGHFAQGLGMRLSYLIGSVNRWFARVVFERDTWDVWLEETAEQADSWWELILFNIARIGVWFSRLILHGLMLLGHGISCFMSRQMEYDADLHEIRLSGSAVFERTTQKLATLGLALERCYKSMRAQWNSSRQLPDSVPTALRLAHEQLPPTLIEEIHGELGLRRSGAFATHPSPAERIRQARFEAAPGILHDERPATVLFENFAIPARQVTLLHYRDDLGLAVTSQMLVSVTNPSHPGKVDVSGDADRPGLLSGLEALVLPFKHDVEAQVEDLAAAHQAIAELDARLEALRPTLEGIAQEHAANHAGWATAEAINRLHEAGVPVATGDAPSAEEWREIVESQRRSLREVVEALDQRFQLALTIHGARNEGASSAAAELASLADGFVRWRRVADELAVVREAKKLLSNSGGGSAKDILNRQLQLVEQMVRDIRDAQPAAAGTSRPRIQLKLGADANTQTLNRLSAEAEAGMTAYLQRIHTLWQMTGGVPASTGQ
jgi:Zn-dependent protease with chaperone function